MSELCRKFSGGDNALLISLRAAFDRGSGAKIVTQGKNLVGFVLFVDEAGFKGRCSHSSRRGPWNFLSQFYKITSPNCQQYPSHCSILEM